MTATDRIMKIREDLVRLHRDPELTAQDRHIVMSVSELLCATSPELRRKNELINDLVNDK